MQNDRDLVASLVRAVQQGRHRSPCRRTGHLDAPKVQGAGGLASDGQGRAPGRDRARQFPGQDLQHRGRRARVNGEVSITGPWTSPLIATAPSAPLVVSDAVGTLPSASSDTAAAKAAPPVDPRFNVAVQLGAPGKTVSVRSPLLQADANGDVELGGRVSAPELRAHLTVARGQFILPPTTRLVIVRPEDGTSQYRRPALPRRVARPGGQRRADRGNARPSGRAGQRHRLAVRRLPPTSPPSAASSARPRRSRQRLRPALRLRPAATATRSRRRSTAC